MKKLLNQLLWIYKAKKQPAGVRRTVYGCFVKREKVWQNSGVLSRKLLWRGGGVFQ